MSSPSKKQKTIPTRIFVTGAFGQIGSDLVPVLIKRYGISNVICLSHKKSHSEVEGIIIEKGDVTNKQLLEEIVEKYQINQIYHLSSLLSANGELDHNVTFDVNLHGLKNILDISHQFGLKGHAIKIFWPSSVAAFGSTTPKTNTPQHTILEPTTIYGVTKVSGELLCNYYFLKFGVDVRSLRYPGIISWKERPPKIGGTSDYSVAIFL